MNFLEPEILLGDWYRIETTCGTHFLPIECFGWTKQDIEEFESSDNSEWKALVEEYVEGKPLEIEIIRGWGIRGSASGYLDCTEWAVFDTEQEAVDFYAEANEYHWDELDEVEW